MAAMGWGGYEDTVLSLARWQPWAVESTGIQCGAGLAGSHGLGWVRGYSAELGSLAAVGCGEYGDTVRS
eukprot:COSAG03_NODE_21319_length_305_cov_44.927184_1_plen_68_part_10